jgi:hypothetical protein
MDRNSNTLKGQVLAHVLANVLLPQNSQGFHQVGRSRAGFRRPAQKSVLHSTDFLNALVC